MPSPITQIADLIRRTDSFLVSSHANPDGDAIGSTVALGHILAHMGKEFCLYNRSGLPAQFDWRGQLDLRAGLRSPEPRGR